MDRVSLSSTLDGSSTGSQLISLTRLNLRSISARKLYTPQHIVKIT